MTIRISHKIAALGLLGLLGLGLASAIHAAAEMEQGRFEGRATRATEALAIVNRISQGFLNSRRAEKDFLLRSDWRYVESHKSLAESVAASLDALLAHPIAREKKSVEGKAGEIRSDFADYRKTFADVSSGRLQLGLTPDAGLEGALRKSVHAIETRLQSFARADLDAAMLMLRRHEKDFMLRRDAKYGAALTASAATFSRKLAASSLAADEQGVVAGLLADYVRDFQRWMDTAEKLGVMQNKLSQQSAAIEGLVEEVRRDVEGMAAEAAAAATASRAKWMQWVNGITGLMVLAMAAAVYVLGRSISRPIAGLSDNMRRIAAGDLGVAVAGCGRADEIGEMAQALDAFRRSAIDKVRLEAESAQERHRAEAERAAREAEKARAAEQAQATIDTIGRALSRLAEGDLLCEIQRQFSPEFEKLRADFNASVGKLRAAMLAIVASAQTIDVSSGEISSAADNLSGRTERQAASLEETAAALDVVTQTVKQTASSAGQASDIVAAASKAADATETVVRQAAAAMQGIERSAAQIGQIIAVIDEIAFQTNLLALNAGVEAARAGDAGRGFAVVASEVRALAQRSAEAAKEIKTLISDSTGQVAEGSALFAKTGEAIEAIIGHVSQINTVVAGIAVGAQEQSTGLTQINTAVNDMDQTTQQNAAMVEETTATSHALKQEIGQLMALIGQFKVDERPGASRPVARAA